MRGFFQKLNEPEETSQSETFHGVVHCEKPLKRWPKFLRYTSATHYVDKENHNLNTGCITVDDTEIGKVISQLK